MHVLPSANVKRADHPDAAQYQGGHLYGVSYGNEKSNQSQGSGCSLGLPVRPEFAIIFEAKQSVTKAIRDDEPEIKNVQDSPTIDRSQASEGMPG